MTAVHTIAAYCIMFVVAAGCLFAIPFLLGEASKNMDELSNEITGENNPIYGDEGNTTIILKEKLPTRSLLISEYYLIDENNTFYACNNLSHYIDPVIGKQYKIEWYYASGYRIRTIQEVVP